MAMPRALALLVCDSVAGDPSGKITLYGVFDSMFFQQFPAIHAQFSIYWKCLITEPGRLTTLIEGEDHRELFRSDATAIDAPGKMAHAQGVYTLIGVQIPSPGKYTVKLVYNDSEIISSTYLQVLQQTAHAT